MANLNKNDWKTFLPKQTQKGSFTLIVLISWNYSQYENPGLKNPDGSNVIGEDGEDLDVLELQGMNFMSLTHFGTGDRVGLFLAVEASARGFVRASSVRLSL